MIGGCSSYSCWYLRIYVVFFLFIFRVECGGGRWVIFSFTAFWVGSGVVLRVRRFFFSLRMSF